ncbi:MAG: MATE family efflux transporter [Acidobacteria bacterium]|nr:MATE family efflux transporter [Acidobacteriota bacterium]MCB9398828.1 MATE family efflux transporter [Acidobacteriota bacterium]
MFQKKTDSRLRRVWSLIRLALSGQELDFTQGDLKKGIWILAIPMVLEMVLESVFALVDVIWVSRLGAAQVAVVGLTESINTLVYALGIGLSMGTTAMVSRRIGEKDKQGAQRAASQAIWLGVLASLPIMLLGLFGARWVLGLMGAEPEVVEVGLGYTQWLLGGNLCIIQLFIINAIFRGAGDPSLAMRSLWFANGLNLILDPCLIFGWGPFPELGVTGAAVATNVGRAAGVLFQLTLLMRGRGRLALKWKDWAWKPKVMSRLAQLSAGGIGQFLVATSSWVFLVRISAQFGSEALAGYTIGIRVLMFTLLPAWGFSNAAATLVGQNLGAGQPDRAEKAVWMTGKINTVFMLTVGLIFFLAAEPIAALFQVEEPVAQVAADCLRWISLGYPFYGLGMVLVQAFNGAGDTLKPTYLNLICFWAIEIPLAYLLALPLGLGPLGVFLAIASCESLMTVFAWLVFRRGTWKHIQV